MNWTQYRFGKTQIDGVWEYSVYKRYYVLWFIPHWELVVYTQDFEQIANFLKND